MWRGLLALLTLASAGCDSVRDEIRAKLKAAPDAGSEDAAVASALGAGPVAASGPASASSIARESGASPADARKRAWLSSPLTGRDNDVAAFRLVQITSAGSGFRLFVKNQFRLACGLTFDADGRPSEASDCKGEWRAREARIRFACREQGASEICRAPFTLVSPDGFATPAGLEIVRPTAAAIAAGPNAVTPPSASDCPRVCAKLASCKRFFFANAKLEECAGACAREMSEASRRATLTSEVACLVETGRRCEDLVTCGSVRMSP